MNQNNESWNNLTASLKDAGVTCSNFKRRRDDYIADYVSRHVGSKTSDFINIGKGSAPTYVCPQVAKDLNVLISNRSTNRGARDCDYRDKLADKIQDSVCEYSCENGYIDIFSPFLIIEVKVCKGWKGAVGQVICYGIEYPKHTKVIALFDCKNCDKKKIVDCCNKLNIDVWFLL